MEGRYIGEGKKRSARLLGVFQKPMPPTLEIELQFRETGW